MGNWKKAYVRKIDEMTSVILQYILEFSNEFFHILIRVKGAGLILYGKRFLFSNLWESMGNWKKEYDREIDEMTSVEEDKCHQFSHSKKMHSVKLKSAKLKEDICKSSWLRCS